MRPVAAGRVAATRGGGGGMPGPAPQQASAPPPPQGAGGGGHGDAACPAAVFVLVGPLGGVWCVVRWACLLGLGAAGASSRSRPCEPRGHAEGGGSRQELPGRPGRQGTALPAVGYRVRWGGEAWPTAARGCPLPGPWRQRALLRACPGPAGPGLHGGGCAPERLRGCVVADEQPNSRPLTELTW